jgi:hypothetical protein
LSPILSAYLELCRFTFLLVLEAIVGDIERNPKQYPARGQRDEEGDDRERVNGGEENEDLSSI